VNTLRTASGAIAPLRLFDNSHLCSDFLQLDMTQLRAASITREVPPLAGQNPLYPRRTRTVAT
jgi:hypothetical protein